MKMPKQHTGNNTVSAISTAYDPGNKLYKVPYATSYAHRSIHSSIPLTGKLCRHARPRPTPRCSARKPHLRIHQCATADWLGSANASYTPPSMPLRYPVHRIVISSLHSVRTWWMIVEVGRASLLILGVKFRRKYAVIDIGVLLLLRM